MQWLNAMVDSARSLLRRRSKEQGLDEELRFHLDRQIEQNLGAGMTPAEYRRNRTEYPHYVYVE